MTCGIERPDPVELFRRYREMFSTYVLRGHQVVPESNEWYVVALNYAMAEEFHAIVDERLRAMDPRTACCEELVRMAALAGIYPRDAVPAQGYIKFRGTPGTPITQALTFSIGGYRFVPAVAASVPTAMPASGQAIVRVVAEQPGALPDIRGLPVRLTQTIAGLERNAELCGAICGGADREDCEQFRARYLRRLRVQPRSRQSWLIDKIMEWPCVTHVFPRGGVCCECQGDCDNDCSCKDCGGRLHFYAMFHGTFPAGAAPPEVVRELEDWLFGNPQGFGLGEVEIGICGRIYPVTPVDLTVRVALPACVSESDRQRIANEIRQVIWSRPPSTVLPDTDLLAAVAGVLGTSAGATVSFELPDGAPARVTPCGVEPECDVALHPADVIVFSPPGPQVRC